MKQATRWSLELKNSARLMRRRHTATGAGGRDAQRHSCGKTDKCRRCAGCRAKPRVGTTYFCLRVKVEMPRFSLADRNASVMFVRLPSLLVRLLTLCGYWDRYVVTNRKERFEKRVKCLV